MSRVDGAATVQDLADLTNLEPDMVQDIVGKLVELGVAEWADGAISLPRASLRPGTPAEPVLRHNVPLPRTPHVKRHVTESQPPTATREPGAPPLRFPRQPSSPYLERINVSETVDPTRNAATSSGEPTGGSSPPGARVHLRSSAGTAPSPGNRGPSEPPPGEPPPPDPSEPLATAATMRPPPAAPASAPPSATSPGDTPGDVDLSPERRKRVDDLYPVLELLDHYEVLGLTPAADIKDVRAAYFSLSKVFHPDTAFRKKLGVYKPKMEAIFSRLTEAYEVLGKKKARAEYDAYLALQGDTRAVEAAMRAPSVPPASPRAPSAPPRAPSAPPPAPPSAPPPSAAVPVADPRRSMSEEGRRHARELLEKRLGGLRSSSPRPPPPAAEPAPSAAPRGREEIVRDLAGSLKSAASITGGLDAVQRHVIAARRAEQEGDLASAARELRLAVALAPDRAELKADEARVSGVLAAQLAEKYELAAEYEEKHKKWAAAALSWSKVVQGRPDDPKAMIRGAIALVEAKGDLHRAQKLAQRACELVPESVPARVALGRVFIAAGLGLNARRELERAALLDPGDQIVKNLLRNL